IGGIGIIAGVINVIAAGGSLLVLPMLIFLGIPPVVANGTNRLAIISQNVFAVAGFRSKNVSTYPFSLYVGLFALAGAFLGAELAITIPEALFNKVLAVVMVLAVSFILFNSIKTTKEQIERLHGKYKVLSFILFFIIGIYGGFIQAGVGFLIMATLNMVNRLSLVKTNETKVTVVLIFNIAALLMFIINGKVWWKEGLVLAIGNSIGAWIASRVSVNKGDNWVKWFLFLTVTVLAIKLWFFSG
ncbi:MAG: sulfite exporter TauE/SafE family protein, partial [Flavobacteriales bacterium]